MTDRGLLANTRSRLEHHGCGVLDVEVVRLRPAPNLDALAPALEAAATLGARHLLVVGEDGENQQLAEALHELCLRAAPLGLRPVLEFIPFTRVATLAQAVAIVRAADHPAAGVLVDPHSPAALGRDPVAGRGAGPVRSAAAALHPVLRRTVRGP